LDEKLDYYFGTYDINPYNPSERGLPFEEIEAFLDKIPARNRIILLDTCHSGEVDKEFSADFTIATNNNSQVKTRALKLFRVKNELGYKNTTRLMEELFLDLRKGTGAYIISSSSGYECSLESEKWSNGVFTYSFLEGLKTKNADLDSNGNITISETKNYVIKKVMELTAGRQNPTTRKINRKKDFILLK